MSTKYYQDGCKLCRNGKEGAEQLTNFTARIKRELIYHDANKATTHLAIDGRLDDEEVNDKGELVWPEGRTLPEITIPATEFANMSWVPEKWGMQPIIFPAAGAERDLRTAIQIGSKPEKEHIYTHTGWTNIGKIPHFLTMSGGIGPKGLDKTIRVELPHELGRYSLPEPIESREAFVASMRLINMGPAHTTWPLLLATYRAAVRDADFALHLAGRTGTFKSEVCSLFQSHFGGTMDARHLPGNWSSTAGATEALAYRAKNALFVIDDFIPVGTSYHVRNLHKTADQLFRAQGNQAGRQRLTDVSQMQTTYYPRGIILSTGEDVPEGHSMRGRMLILELTPGDIEKAKLSEAQSQRQQYPQAMADWIKWLAETNAAEMLVTAAHSIRDKHLDVGHSRTPGIIGDLVATLHLLGEYAQERGYLTAEQWSPIAAKGEAAVLAAANSQRDYLEQSDPTQAVLETIRLMLGSGLAHAKSKNGGIPEDGEKYGWKKEMTIGELPSYKMQGPRIGWVDPGENLFYLDANAITLLKKYSGGKIAVTPQTLQKRMKEAGLLVRCDDTRQRNTVRLMLERHRRQVLCLSLAEVFDDTDD